MLRIPVFFPAHQTPSEKGSNLKGKKLLTLNGKTWFSMKAKFAPLRSKLFPFTVDPFSEGRQKQFSFDRVVSLETVSIPSNIITVCMVRSSGFRILFQVNWPGVDGKRHISNVYGYYFELDWGIQHQRVPSLEYIQLYDAYDITDLRSYGWVNVSVGGGYHSCSFTYDFRKMP